MQLPGYLENQNTAAAWSEDSGSNSVATDVEISASLIAVHDVEGFISKSQG